MLPVFGKSTLSGFVTLTTRVPISSSTKGDGATTRRYPRGHYQKESIDVYCGTLAAESATPRRRSHMRKTHSRFSPHWPHSLLAATAGAVRSTPSASSAIPGCGKGSLKLVNDGQLTIGADNPAFPPWFGGAEKTKPWKVSDPYSGKGYESAVAYAVARQLGFPRARGEVDGRSVHELVQAREEAVRLLHRPGFVQPAAGVRRLISRSRTTSSTNRSSGGRASRSRV